MMIRSFSHYREVREYDVDLGLLSSGPLRESAYVLEEVLGHFDYIGDQLVAVYRRGESVVLQFGARKIDLNEETTIEYGEEIDRMVFRVSSRSHPEIDTRIEFQKEESKVTIRGVDITPFAEDEDFDFALYLSNLARNPERLRRVYRHDMK